MKPANSPDNNRYTGLGNALLRYAETVTPITSRIGRLHSCTIDQSESSHIMTELLQLTDRAPSFAKAAMDAINEMYRDHEIDATEYASLMEDIALVSRKR